MWLPSAFLLAVMALFSAAAGQKQTFKECQLQLKAWAGEMNAQRNSTAHEHGDTSPELLFFLHIPRTGGRTFHQCLLKSVIPRKQHCPRSYDILQVNLRDIACRLLVSHDDYSVLRRVGGRHVSVMTNVRDPTERILSAYEFTAEIVSRAFAARRRRAPAPSTLKMGPQRREDAKRAPHRLATTNVWPWSKLVPMMEAEVLRRNLVAAGNGTIDAEGRRPKPKRFLSGAESVMPLAEFVEHPLVADLLHNGATLQIAGLTDTSLLPSASALRACVQNHPALGEHVLTVAKHRLSSMYAVGLSDTPEQHRESAALLANKLSPKAAPSGLSQRGKTAVAAGHFGESYARRIPSNEGWSERVMRKYQRCVEVQQKRYTKRREEAMQNLASPTLSREMRVKIPEETLSGIKAMNRLDVELHAFAKELFHKDRVLSGAKEEGRIRSGMLHKRKESKRTQSLSSRTQHEWSIWRSCCNASQYLGLDEMIEKVLGARFTHYAAKYLVWARDLPQDGALLLVAFASAVVAVLFVHTGLARTLVMWLTALYRPKA